MDDMRGIVAAGNDSDCVSETQCVCVRPCQGLSRLSIERELRHCLKGNKRDDKRTNMGVFESFVMCLLFAEF